MNLPRGSIAWVLAAVQFLAAAGIAAAASHASDVPKGVVLKLKMEAPAVGEQSRTVRIYLPPSYDRPESINRRYPVVYLLHGWPGSDGNLLEFAHANATADSLIARGAIPEIIMVFPNGAGSGLLGRSYWINSYDGRKRLEDFVTQDVVGWVDTHFRTLRRASGRGIVGISEGGDAAVNLAFKHPDLFAACGGHSGDYVLTRAMGTGAFLGSDPGAQRLLDDNSPVKYVDRIVDTARRLTIYLDCGTSDESLAHSRAFHEKLQRLGIAHEYHEFPGSHTWGYWGHHLRESLLAVAGALR